MGFILGGSCSLSSPLINMQELTINIIALRHSNYPMDNQLYVSYVLSTMVLFGEKFVYKYFAITDQMRFFNYYYFFPLKSICELWFREFTSWNHCSVLGWRHILSWWELTERSNNVWAGIRFCSFEFFNVDQIFSNNYYGNSTQYYVKYPMNNTLETVIVIQSVAALAMIRFIHMLFKKNYHNYQLPRLLNYQVMGKNLFKTPLLTRAIAL